MSNDGGEARSHYILHHESILDFISIFSHCKQMLPDSNANVSPPASAVQYCTIQYSTVQYGTVFQSAPIQSQYEDRNDYITFLFEVIC